MRKTTIAFVLALTCALGLTGCSGTPANDAEEEQWDLIPMVMVDGVLYLDTGYNSNGIRKCGTPDGEITSAVDGSEEPTEDDQSNFGTGFGYRYGVDEGTIELYLNNRWRIFATEEARERIQFPERNHGSEIPGGTQFIVEIRDRTAEEQLACDSALEKFYEDEQAEYYFSCIKSQYITVTYNNGNSEDLVTALTAGRAVITDLDRFGIAYHTEAKAEIEIPYVSIADFSYAEDCRIYQDGEPGVKTSGFVNTAEAEILDMGDADRRAQNECTIEWDTAATYLDTAAGIWKVVFSSGKTPGSCQSVYLDYSGKTVLIVYGE